MFERLARKPAAASASSASSSGDGGGACDNGDEAGGDDDDGGDDDGDGVGDAGAGVVMVACASVFCEQRRGQHSWFMF